MTANPEPGPPDQNTVLIIAYGWVHAWLADDYWTVARLMAELEDLGATMQQVAECFSLAAAALLTDAAGDKYAAMALAARKCSEKVGRRARSHAA